MNDILFSPLRIGKLEIAGRIYKTATSETRATPDGFIDDEFLAFYEPIARAGTPLIISGNLYSSEQGKSTYRMGGIDNDDKLPGLRRLTALAHAHGSRIFAQINHCGRQTLPWAMGRDCAVSASDVSEKFLGTKPRPLTRDEIRGVVREHAEAAARAVEAGFDGIQLHVGHGYLLNQFLTPYTNRRTDEYGGSFENRQRLLREVYDACREAVGADYPIIAKINGHDELAGRDGLDTPALVAVARMLEERGLDAVEITVGHYESGMPMVRGRFDAFFHDMVHHGLGTQVRQPRRALLRAGWRGIAAFANRAWPYEEGFNLKYAREFRRELTIPVICVGGFATREGMEVAIGSGQVDAVSSARAMIADPYLVRHIRDGVPGPRCNFCNACIARAGAQPVDCYEPAIAREKAAMLARG